MLGYLSAGIICSEKQTAIQGRGLKKTVSFEEKIMSRVKISEAVVFIIVQIFFTVCAVLKIGEYSQF